MPSRRSVVFLLGVLTAAVWWKALPAQEKPPVDPSLFAEMKWRSIGPHRASRTVAAAGHPRRPFTFYMAQVNGGVWKTTDAGRTWNPTFDDQPTGSIGVIAVAPSNPDIVYVGSGEGLHRPDLSTGNGVYKSTDAGRTWTHLGLPDAQQIPSLSIDPRNPDRIFVAALGHPYGPNYQNGWFNPENPDIMLLAADQGAVVTLNGGQTWSSWYCRFKPFPTTLPRSPGRPSSHPAPIG